MTSDAEAELAELRALTASDDPVAALARERLHAHKQRERLERSAGRLEAALREAEVALERIASNAGFGTPGTLGSGWADNEARQRMRVAREALVAVRALLAKNLDP